MPQSRMSPAEMVAALFPDQRAPLLAALQMYLPRYIQSDDPAVEWLRAVAYELNEQAKRDGLVAVLEAYRQQGDRRAEAASRR